MRKIRKYKVNIRPSVVGRLLTKIFSVSADYQNLESEIQADSDLISKKVIPATVYETYFVPNLPAPLSDIPREKNVFGFTLSATTLGEVEKDLLSGLEMTDIRYQIRHCILLEFLEQAANFVARLIPEELKEDVTLLKNERIDDPDRRIQLSKLLVLDKINLKVVDGKFSAAYSTLNLFSWQVQKRR